MSQRQKDEQQIRARIREWVETVKTGDAARVARFYTADGKFLAPNRPIAEGRDQVARAWDGLLKLPNLALTFGPTRLEVAEAGDMAYEVGTYSLSFDGPNGRANDEGKYVVVWKKEEGAWRAAADILNSSLPAK